MIISHPVSLPGDTASQSSVPQGTVAVLALQLASCDCPVAWSSDGTTRGLLRACVPAGIYLVAVFSFMDPC